MSNLHLKDCLGSVRSVVGLSDVRTTLGQVLGY